MRDESVGVIHHDSGGGTEGGWRSDLTTENLSGTLSGQGFEILDQFRSWTDSGGSSHAAGPYRDVVTVFRLP
jgi:hypothetical protein